MENRIRLSKDSREPFYYQVEEQIKALIASGQMPAGTPLPSIRSLSKDLEVSVITTRRAYQNLENQGFIHTTQGKGTFVEEIQDTLKDDVAASTVRKAFERAVETAYRHDFKQEEIEQLFQDVIERTNTDEEGE